MSNDVETALARLEPWQEKVSKSETESILDRWEFGRVLLEMRGDRKQLPKGLRALLTEHFRLEASEITRRMQLAEKFTTEGEVVNACTSCSGSWRRFIADHLVKNPRRRGEPLGVERFKSRLSRLVTAAGQSDAERKAFVTVLRDELRPMGLNVVEVEK